MNSNSLLEIRKQVLSGKYSLTDLIRLTLQKIEQKKELNAFLQVFPDRALKKATIVDQKIRSGTSGKLAGLVIAVKDVICVKGEKATCGSKILETFVSPYDATVIEKLEQEDAILIGKTNMDEFAMGSSNENSAFGNVKNPIDPLRSPGGSSGGSAAAVAAGIVPVALGTDTGGSIRQPGSFCGVIGFKPTYGRVSRRGLIAFASSLDQIGPLTKTVEQTAEVLNVICGYDPCDSTSANLPVPDFTQYLTREVKNLKGGLPKEYYKMGLDAETRSRLENVIEKLKVEGVEIQEVSLPTTDYAIATYYIIATAEASSNLARFDGARYGYRDEMGKNLEGMYIKSRSRGFGPEVKRRIMLGTYVLSAGYYDAFYRKAQKIRRLIKNDFERVFKEVDFLLTPTSPTPAFPLGEKVDDPLAMYLSDVYTVPASLAGIPGVNIPLGFSKSGLPLGAQILAKYYDEGTCICVGNWIEKINW